MGIPYAKKKVIKNTNSIPSNTNSAPRTRIVSKQISIAEINKFIIWVDTLDAKDYPIQAQAINQAQKYTKSRINSVLTLYNLWRLHQ